MALRDAVLARRAASQSAELSETQSAASCESDNLGFMRPPRGATWRRTIADPPQFFVCNEFNAIAAANVRHDDLDDLVFHTGCIMSSFRWNPRCPICPDATEAEKEAEKEADALEVGEDEQWPPWVDAWEDEEAVRVAEAVEAAEAVEVARVVVEVAEAARLAEVATRNS